MLEIGRIVRSSTEHSDSQKFCVRKTVRIQYTEINFAKCEKLKNPNN